MTWRDAHELLLIEMTSREAWERNSDLTVMVTARRPVLWNEKCNSCVGQGVTFGRSETSMSLLIVCASYLPLMAKLKLQFYSFFALGLHYTDNYYIQ